MQEISESNIKVPHFSSFFILITLGGIANNLKGLGDARDNMLKAKGIQSKIVVVISFVLG